MKKIFKHFSRKTLKEDFRKLGVNFMTASGVGIFITHTSDLSLLAFLLIIWLGIMGLIIFLVGIYKFDEV